MLPINNNIQPISLNNQEIQVSFNELLISEWKEWAKNGNPEKGEERDSAVYRLIDCLEREATRLDLNDLFLTALPNKFPPSVTQLDIFGNPLTSLELDKLPQSISLLILSQNQVPLLIGQLISIPRIEIPDGQPPFIIGSYRTN